MIADTGKRMTVFDRLLYVFRGRKPKDIVSQAEDVVARYAMRCGSITILRRRSRYRKLNRMLNVAIASAAAVCLYLAAQLLIR